MFGLCINGSQDFMSRNTNLRAEHVCVCVCAVPTFYAVAVCLSTGA